MISIISCSIKPELCQKMFASIQNTIGTEFEQIIIDNREKKYSLFKAYNEGAMQAKGKYLLFIHEDIEIKNMNWGAELVKFAEQDNDCGVIGVAGNKFLPRNFWAWSSPHKYNVIRLYGPKEKDHLDKKCFSLFYNNPRNELFSKAVCLDGVFLFVKKNIWEKNKFDEINYNGFHFYDADFTFKIAQTYQNFVYLGMDIYHYSIGNRNKDFCESLLIFHKLWKHAIPYTLPCFKISILNELTSAFNIYKTFKKNKYKKREILKILFDKNGYLFMILFFLRYPQIIFI